MLKNTPANVWQELLLAPLNVPQPVDLGLIWEAMKTAPQVVQVVAKPPPKP